MSLIRDLNALIDQRQGKTLAEVKRRGSLAGQTSSSAYKESGTTGAIASPLTETVTTNDDGTSTSTRAYHEARMVETSDGLFSFLVKPIKTLNMQDANRETVVMNFANPDQDKGTK